MVLEYIDIAKMYGPIQAAIHVQTMTATCSSCCLDAFDTNSHWRL